MDRRQARDLLDSYFSTAKLSLGGQNIKYDYKVLSQWGIKVKSMVFDTMVAAWLLDSTSVFNMDYLAEKYLNHKTVRYSDIVPKDKLLSDIPLDQAVFYGAEDADITFRLYKLFAELLAARNLRTLLDELEMPLLRIIAEMELAASTSNASSSNAFSEFEQRIDAIRSQIFSCAD